MFFGTVLNYSVGKETSVKNKEKKAKDQVYVHRASDKCQVQ